MVMSSERMLLCFCGDLNATLDQHLDASPGEMVYRTCLAACRGRSYRDRHSR